MDRQRPITWIGDSQDRLRDFPTTVRREMGYALYLAQTGGKHPKAKFLTGRKDFSGGKVVEVVENDNAGTCRTVYSTRIDDDVYVLHAFQKKSKRGIATPKEDIDVIVRRLKAAEVLAAGRRRGGAR